MTVFDLLRSSLVAVSDAIARREVTSRDLTRAALDQVARLDPDLHAFVTVDPEGALLAAASADREIAEGRWRGPLHGVPVAVKDNIATRGLRTTFNSRAHETWVPTRDAEPVARLRRAGAVIVGKTNLNEFAWSVPDTTDLIPPPRNPWNPALGAQGSSSGSAVAVAAGMCCGALGTDAGGSIRLPASQMGLVGLKPTRGAPSDEGALDEVSVVGILARCARDAAAMYTVIADRSGFDLGSPSELRLAVPRRQIDEIRLEDKVAEAFAADLQTLSDLGVRLVEIDLPHLSVARDATFVLISALNHAQWAQDLRESYTLVGPNARRYLLAGGVLAVEDFVNARRVAALFEDRLTRTITDCAGVVTPVSPVTTVEAARRPGEHNRGFDATFTAPFNAIGWPAISIPTRVGDHGLRIGVQVAARPWQEALLLELAHLLENELGLRE